MTIEEARTSDKPMLTCHDISKIVGISDMRLRAQAQKDPSMLGFPVCTAGRTVRIPRLAFLAWLSGTQNGKGDSEDI